MVNNEEFRYLLQETARAVPLFASYMEEKATLLDYSYRLAEYRPAVTHRERQEELAKLAKEYVSRMFQDAGMAERLDFGPPVYSVVDHHDILNHPLLISPNLIANLGRIKSGRPGQSILVLSDSGIPVNHYGNKRGMSFGGRHLRTFTHRQRHAISYALPAIPTFSWSAQRAKEGAGAEEVIFLEGIERLLSKEYAKYPPESYTDQVTIINRTLWKQLFSPDLQEHLPDLYYVPCEVLAELLLKRFLADKSSVFCQVLFNTNLREKVLGLFEHIKGCWSNDRSYGTHFFWGINEDCSQEHLWLEGNELRSSDGDISVIFEPEAIVEAMQAKRIYPGLFLTYGMIAFHFGIKPLTGFASTDYMTRMKAAWITLHEEFGNTTEVELLNGIPTNNLIQGPKTIYQFDGAAYRDLYSLDIIWQGGITRSYLEQLGTVPLDQALQPGLVDVYDSYVLRETGRKLQITESDLAEEGFGWTRTAWNSSF